MMDVTLGAEALNEDGYKDYAKSAKILTNSQTFASQRFSQLVSATEIFTNKKNINKPPFMVLKMIFAFLNR